MANKVLWLLSAAFCVFGSAGQVCAQSTESAPEDAGVATEGAEEPAESQDAEDTILNRITVSGGKEGVAKVPGSAYFLSGEELEDAQTGLVDVHRVLRQVPGVNIQEEEGYGLRPNIGLRGTSTERSDGITLMEDGVLIAPAPYAAPAAYYFPTVGRMEGIEVLKGASQVKYGPRTIGGSLNLLSTSIPDELDLQGEVGAGTDSTTKMHLHGGNSWKYGGAMLETYQAKTDGFKDLDGGGDTGYDLEDYVGKFRLNTDPERSYYQQVELKLGYTDQDSDETYLGLTKDDFDADPYRRYRGSQLDNIQVEHRQVQVRHFADLGSGFDLTTTAYYNKTKRAWYKLENVDGVSNADILDNPDEFASQLDWIRGADSPEGVFAVRNNNREYYGKGVQSVLGAELETGSISHLVEVGARYHSDEEDRFQQDDKYTMSNGDLSLATAGAPGSNANRVLSADAWAFYLQDEITIDALTLTPGARYERINLTREDYGRNDPDRTGVDLSRNDSDVDAIIPGLGAHYQLSNTTAVFGGVHKGFSPPGPSSDDEIEEEESVNYELGGNVTTGAFNSELVFFYNDYENLLGADTLSSGGTGSGDLFNAGEATVYGLELALRDDFAELLELPVRLPAYVSYTYTQAQFDSSFDSTFFGEVQDGDDIPYIPDHQAAAGISVEHEAWGSLGIRSYYVNAMPIAAGEANLAGGPKTDAHFIVDATAELAITEEASFFVDVLNVFDEEYVAARRPAGARPGLPLTALAGVKFDL
ncbi:MAG: TonB-dependent receptor [Bdellovibrionales bacterium]|nr:TonB-dependent receptor [Bdellovibrionales bacterium]